MCDNFQSYNQTKTYKSVYYWTDDDNNYFTVGGMMATTTTTQHLFLGMIHEIQIYSKVLARSQIND